jgi:hypothetical protein
MSTLFWTYATVFFKGYVTYGLVEYLLVRLLIRKLINTNKYDLSASNIFIFMTNIIIFLNFCEFYKLAIFILSWTLCSVLSITIYKKVIPVRHTSLYNIGYKHMYIRQFIRDHNHGILCYGWDVVFNTEHSELKVDLSYENKIKGFLPGAMWL